MSSHPVGASVGASGRFSAQCAACEKWRFIPTRKMYEEIRECFLQVPFVCEDALQWKADASCDDPSDLSQDDLMDWAFDKPGIPRTPPGWERKIRIRAQGGTHFADVYYYSPTGKRLRSMSDVYKYLTENDEYIREGLDLSHFSFEKPIRPEDYYARRQNRSSRDSGYH